MSDDQTSETPAFTHEVTPRCATCGVDLPAGLYAEDTDHTRGGYCPIMVAAHLGMHPGHEITYTRETIDEADSRRAAERERGEDSIRQAQRTAQEHREGLEARAIAAERRQRRAPRHDTGLYIPRRRTP